MSEIKNTLKKNSKAGKVVVSTCTGTFTTA